MKRYLFIAVILLYTGSVNAEGDSQVYLETSKPQLRHIKTFYDWKVYNRMLNGITECHAISVPYRTKAFEGVREAPYLILSYKGKRKYTLSLFPGFIVDKQNGAILETNNRSHILNTVLPRAAWSFSSIQDKAIIEDMIKDGRSLSIRSYNASQDTALDFYSIKGLVSALQYMEKSCPNRYRY